MIALQLPNMRFETYGAVSELRSKGFPEQVELNPWATYRFLVELEFIREDILPTRGDVNDLPESIRLEIDALEKLQLALWELAGERYWGPPPKADNPAWIEVRKRSAEVMHLIQKHGIPPDPDAPLYNNTV
jgi:hypothetical protein